MSFPPALCIADYRDRSFTIRHCTGDGSAMVLVLHSCASGRSILWVFSLPVANAYADAATRSADLAARVRRCIDQNIELIGD